MLSGYAGNILRINLTERTSRREKLPESLARDYIGGRGFVSKLLYDEVPAGVKPLSPENKVVMAAGPLSGVFMPCSSKLSMGTLSPLTGGYGDSSVGGHLVAEMKFAGYDVIILEGAAARPTVVVIDDSRVEFRDSGALWGKGAIETEKALKDELGEDFQIAAIGPAGENLVKFACVSHDFGRQAGRTGVGTVFGSKKLKAVAVRGSGAVPLANPRKVLEQGKAMFEVVFSKPGFKEWTPYGTAEITDWVNEVGVFPTRNFQTGYFEPFKEINGRTLRKKILVRDKGCFGCPIPCGKYSKAVVGDKEFYVEGPEYESIALLGGNLSLKTIEEIAYANYVCDELGLDSISGGNVVGFALECYEKGIISKEEAGRPLAFGDIDSVAYLLEQIAFRRGVGDVLAEGVRTAAGKFGRGSERFAMHIKGLEFSGYESRWAPGMLLAYMTADVGAHHNRAWAITYDIASGRENLEGKPEKVVELQHLRPLFDTFGVCRFPWVEIGFEMDHYLAMFGAVTGRDLSWDDLYLISERVWNLNRAFNIRHIPGFGRSYDYPPARVYEEGVLSGPTEGKHITREDVEKLLDRYYELRGWSSDGRPTRRKLADLGLEHVADELKLA